MAPPCWTAKPLDEFEATIAGATQEIEVLDEAARELVRRVDAEAPFRERERYDANLVSYRSAEVRKFYGKDPRQMNTASFWTAAAIQGGGLGILGDLLYQGLTRADTGLSGTLGGPLAAAVDAGAQLVFPPVAALAAGEETNFGATLARHVRRYLNPTPFYLRLAVDRLFFDEVQALIDPEYRRSFRRIEQRAEENFGTSFLVAAGRGGTGQDAKPRECDPMTLPSSRGVRLPKRGRPPKRQKKRLTGLSRRVRAAIDLMIFGGADGVPMTRPRAAKAVGFSDTTLREALRNPLVVAHYNQVVGSLKNSEKARALHAIINLRDGAESEQVQFRAARFILEDGQRAQNGVNVGLNITPGYVIDLGHVDEAERTQLRDAGLLSASGPRSADPEWRTRLARIGRRQAPPVHVRPVVEQNEKLNPPSGAVCTK